MYRSKLLKRGYIADYKGEYFRGWPCPHATVDGGCLAPIHVAEIEILTVYFWITQRRRNCSIYSKTPYLFLPGLAESGSPRYVRMSFDMLISGTFSPPISPISDSGSRVLKFRVGSCNEYHPPNTHPAPPQRYNVGKTSQGFRDSASGEGIEY